MDEAFTLNAISLRLELVELLLRKSIIKSPIWIGPMAKRVPLRACLRVHFDFVILSVIISTK